MEGEEVEATESSAAPLLKGRGEDLIDQYVEYAGESTDAPSIYHKALAYWVVSTVLGRHVRLVTSYAPSGLMPNLWVMLIGPSRIVRKSTAMRLAVSIVREVAPQLVRKASFTPEALYELCNELNPGDCLAWVKDEIGGFFKTLEKRYMYGVRELLSSMYMGEGEERILRNLRLRIPDGLYVTAVANAPTPPHNYLSKEDFQSGFMNRWILAYATKREKRLPLLHQSVVADSMRREVIARLKELDRALSAVTPVISPTTPAINKLEEYDREIERQIEIIERTAPASLFKLYLAETPNLLVKMTILRRLARGNYDPSGIITIEEADVTRALEDLNAFIASTRQVIDDVQSSPRSRLVLIDEEALERVYNLIAEGGEEGVTWSDLLRRSKILAKDLKEYVLTLMEQERVVCVRRKTGGRPLLTFFDFRYRNVAYPRGEPIDASTLKVLLK